MVEFIGDQVIYYDVGNFMSIFITGDIHGYPIRLADENLDKKLISFGKSDKLIICGDFGLPWYNDEEDFQCLEWLSKRPFEILFIDGNHENFDLLNSFPTEKRYGGQVHKIRDNVYHLMRGEVYVIEDRSFFAFGGASSYDKNLRERHISWWAEEVFNKEEKENAFSNLDRVGFAVDYVITHTAPQRFVEPLLVHLQDVSSCPVATFLEELSYKINWGKWYFGHFHIDRSIDDKITCLYEQIEKLK